jgi:hypothetical protein
MRRPIAEKKLILSILLAPVLLLFATCQVPPRSAAQVVVGNTSTPPEGCPSDFAINSILPADRSSAPGTTDQKQVNCFAWQSFIALNWPADPAKNGQPNPNVQAKDFGEPGDTSSTVWETYKAAQDVFLPAAKSPAGWNDPNTVPTACESKVKNAGLSDHSILYMISKSGGGDVLNDIVEAGTHQILVDQTGRLIRFEKRINQPEFNYVVKNSLYDASQQAVVATRTGIVLPEDSIEVKAAWRQLDGVDPKLAQRYKQTIAFLYDTSTGTCDGPITMGLIALHIIRKTGSMRHIMWSTFEQVDNVGGSAAHPTGVPYTLYNPNCQPPAPCKLNAIPEPTPTPPGIPTYEPVQVSRTLRIPQEVQDLNTEVWSWITNANQDSVWQYYQLINVLWPAGNGADPGPGAPTPINIANSDFTSSGPQAVSNVSLETYVQLATCTACHTSAAIAASTAVGCAPNLASDFSFVFDDADTTDHWRANNCKTPTPTPSP